MPPAPLAWLAISLTWHAAASCGYLRSVTFAATAGIHLNSRDPHTTYHTTGRWGSGTGNPASDLDAAMQTHTARMQSSAFVFCPISGAILWVNHDCSFTFMSTVSVTV